MAPINLWPLRAGTCLTGKFYAFGKPHAPQSPPRRLVIKLIEEEEDGGWLCVVLHNDGKYLPYKNPQLLFFDDRYWDELTVITEEEAAAWSL